MSKTQQLVANVRAGTHRIIDAHVVWRWVPSRGQWVTDPKWRRDVVRSAAVALMPR